MAVVDWIQATGSNLAAAGRVAANSTAAGTYSWVAADSQSGVPAHSGPGNWAAAAPDLVAASNFTCSGLDFLSSGWAAATAGPGARFAGRERSVVEAVLGNFIARFVAVAVLGHCFVEFE